MAHPIHIGTSGFSYADWKGPFYPPALRTGDMLGFYSRHFSACELNASYYRLPTAATTAALIRKSEGRVRFVIKAHGSMTHERTAAEAEYRQFNEALRPLQDAGLLGAVIAQFPYSFPNSLDNRGYVADLRARLPEGTELVVEFRHRSWNHAQVVEWLAGLGVGLVNVDEPDLKGLLPPTDHVTSPVGYVRFHGRNREKWFQKQAQPWERYDYLYQEEELREWVPRIRRIADQAGQTFVFFNNHWQSQAVTNAKQLAALLGGQAGNG
ncbi:MAG: DUF72 domain-containing protein [candidate division FCPU426 bacterium]